MNKRIKKKKSLQQIINRIYYVSHNKSDVIVLEFDREKISSKEIWNLYYMIKPYFENKNVIAIPKGIDLKQYSKHELNNMIEVIQRALDDK